MKRLCIFALVVLLATLCLGCKPAEFETNAYRTLVGAGAVYDVTMHSMADARSEGLITAEQYAKGKVVARNFYALYHAARIALEEYVASGREATDSEAQRERILATLSSMALRLAELTDYLRQIGVPEQGAREVQNG